MTETTVRPSRTSRELTATTSISRGSRAPTSMTDLGLHGRQTQESNPRPSPSIRSTPVFSSTPLRKGKVGETTALRKWAYGISPVDQTDNASVSSSTSLMSKEKGRTAASPRKAKSERAAPRTTTPDATPPSEGKVRASRDDGKEDSSSSKMLELLKARRRARAMESATETE